jgi:hypothetical protein
MNKEQAKERITDILLHNHLAGIITCTYLEMSEIEQELFNVINGIDNLEETAKVNYGNKNDRNKRVYRHLLPKMSQC